MTFKHCVNTPNALELRKFAIEELIKKGKELEGGKKLKKFQRTADAIEKRLPRKNFMINLICQLNPNHKIFTRDYKPPAISSLTEMAED